MRVRCAGTWRSASRFVCTNRERRQLRSGLAAAQVERSACSTVRLSRCVGEGGGAGAGECRQTRQPRCTMNASERYLLQCSTELSKPRLDMAATRILCAVHISSPFVPRSSLKLPLEERQLTLQGQTLAALTKYSISGLGWCKRVF